jgi:phosphonate transport system substrate-binding protein
LQGATWVYNEPGSFSGYEAMRYYLAVQGLDGDFFGRVVTSGSHQRSIEWVLAGDAEVSAIDSTVLSTLLVRRPSLAAQLRVVDSIGPSPMPPWVVAQQVPAEVRQAIRQLMLAMSGDAEGQAILASAGIRRFVTVADGDYDKIRAILRTAARVTVSSGW